MSSLTKAVDEQLASWLFEEKREYVVDKLATSKIGWSEEDRKKLKSHLWRSYAHPVGARVGTLGSAKRRSEP